MLNGKTIVLGVSGGIAAYKAAALCSKLVKQGAIVKVIMTKSATQFITPLTLQTISRNAVMVDTFDERDPSVVSHIDIADSADLIVIAPATANVIAKLATGLADDMLSTTLLAATSPILIAPAMNVHMYEHPAVIHNIDLLASRGVRFIEPGEGALACGYVGKGRLAEPEQIVCAIEALFAEKQLFKGKKVLITAGSTLERIDPVRYITNDSSGKMGFAIAEAAQELGAEVYLVAGSTSVKTYPQGVHVIPVVSAQDMYEAVMDKLLSVDVIIKAAAVADYRPKQAAIKKIKKTDNEDALTLELEKTPDILQAVGQLKLNQYVVGFAAETDHLIEHAQGKLIRKNCDMIVANDVTQVGAGFGTDTNIVTLVEPGNVITELPMMSKQELGRTLLKHIAHRLSKAGDTH